MSSIPGSVEYIAYPVFTEPTITWAPSVLSGYSGVFRRRQRGHAPFGKKISFDHRKKLENLVFPLCVNISVQGEFGPFMKS